MDQGPVINLSEKEKEDFFPSLYFINANLHDFVEKFFLHFLQTGAKDAFKTTDLDNLKKKFESSFKIILYNFQYPINLEDHLNLLIVKHSEYRILPEYFDYFLTSFMETITEILPNNSANSTIEIWNKLITDILNYFKMKMF